MTSLMLLATTCQAGAAPEEPRFSSVVLTEGIRGGIGGPIVRRRVELGYDWNAGDYRVTVYDGSKWETAEGPYSTAVIGRQKFERILRGVREHGLATLPPQLDPDGPDAYGIDTCLEFRDGDLFWVNLASGGCTSSLAKVMPTEAERSAFAGVAKGVLEAVDEIDLALGCELDAGFLFLPTHKREARAFLEASKHVLQQPFAALVDRSRVHVLTTGSQYEFRFAWRALQDLPYRYSRMRRSESCDVLIEHETLAVRGVRSRPFEPSAETLTRRRNFLENRPDLSSRLRRLIAAGWVAGGMTAEMVTAAWGEPRSTDPFAYERHGKSVQLGFDRDGLLTRRRDTVPGSISQ
ncbi:MAG: hypothetical protein ACI8QZ_002815 [Chlamydiales bacterium]|jgi:hypothetical protein